MTPAGWLALAAAAALSVGPRPAGARAVVLSRCGRLDGDGARRPGAAAARLPPARVAAVAAAAAVLTVTATAGVPLGVAVAAIAGVAWSGVRGALAQRRRADADADLATALGVLIGELEAGAGPARALDAAAGAARHHAPAFAEAALVAGAGGDAGLVLRRGPAVRAIGLAWQVGEHTGAALAGVLGRVAADLAAASTQRRAVAVALAGPRSSAALLTGLPALGIALGSAMGARPVDFLLGPPPGSVLCCAGVLFDAAGVLWMRRILRRAAAP